MRDAYFAGWTEPVLAVEDWVAGSGSFEGFDAGVAESVVAGAYAIGESVSGGQM